MCSCSVLVGCGYSVSGAVVYNVYQSWIHPLVSISSIVLFMTRSVNNFLFLFNVLSYLEYG